MARRQPISQYFASYGRDYTLATAALKMPVLVPAGRDDYTAEPRAYQALRFLRQQVLARPGRHTLRQEQPLPTQRAVRTFVAALPVRP